MNSTRIPHTHSVHSNNNNKREMSMKRHGAAPGIFQYTK